MTTATEPEHSKLPPSGSKRWTNCTASVSLVEQLIEAGKIPAESSSVYAEEGVEAHDWASKILEGKASLDDIPDPDMKQHVGDYVRFAQNLQQDGDEIFIEARVPLFYRKKDKGTIDFGLVNPSRVYVLDLKYGQGVMVEAKENPQLATYALSLVEDLDPLYSFTDDTLVIMAIYQPRNREGGLPQKLWAIKLGDLKEWVEHIREAADEIEQGHPLKFAPEVEGICQFCPAKKRCEARAEYVANHFSKESIDAVADLTNITDEGQPVAAMPPALKDEARLKYGFLSDAQITAVVKHGPEVIAWINSIASEAQKTLEAGTPIEGLKLVKGNPGNRSWENEEEADKLIKTKLKAEERYTKKLISLPQAEKLLKGKELSTRFQNRFKELTFRKPGAPTIALAEDPREDIRVKAEDVFENLDAIDEDAMLE